MQIQKKHLSLLFLIFSISYVFIGSFVVYKYKYIQGQNLFDVGFWYGPLIKNIVTTGTYHFGILYACRMPFIPLFLSAIALIYNNLLFAHLVKNILFFSLILVSIIITSKHIKNINRHILWAIFIYSISFPQLVLHSFSIDYGEGYFIAFFSILFVCLLYVNDIKSRWALIVLAILNCLTYLTRGVAPVISVLICLFYYWVTKSRRVFLIFVFSLFTAIMAWGSFNLFNSGKFDILVSIKGDAFYRGNNENTLKIYPKYSVDELSISMPKRNDICRDKGLTEWEIDRYFILKAFEFMKNHPIEEAKLFLVKSYVMFLSVVNPLDENSRRHPVLQYFGILYMIIYRLIFIFCLFIAFKNIFAKKGQLLLQSERKAMVACIYLGFIFGYSFFHLIGFVDQREVVALAPVTLFYLVWVLENRAYRLSAD